MELAQTRFGKNFIVKSGGPPEGVAFSFGGRSFKCSLGRGPAIGSLHVSTDAIFVGLSGLNLRFSFHGEFVVVASVNLELEIKNQGSRPQVSFGKIFETKNTILKNMSNKTRSGAPNSGAENFWG